MRDVFIYRSCLGSDSPDYSQKMNMMNLVPEEENEDPENWENGEDPEGETIISDLSGSEKNEIF